MKRLAIAILLLLALTGCTVAPPDNTPVVYLKNLPCQTRADGSICYPCPADYPLEDWCERKARIDYSAIPTLTELPRARTLAQYLFINDIKLHCGAVGYGPLDMRCAEMALKSPRSPFAQSGRR
jgi:hypothetical protein